MTPTDSINQPFPNGYAACAAWWRDFSDRIDAAEGYFIDPKLREFTQALPADQVGDFIDALGEVLITWKISGEPANDYTNGPPDVAFCKLSRHEQDQQYDDGEPATDLARAMNATQPWEVSHG